MKKLNDKTLAVGDIVKLPKGETGKVLEITKEGISVKNFEEESRIRNTYYKEKKCDYCKKESMAGHLFKEESGDKVKCKTCIDREIQKEKKMFGCDVI